MRRILAAITLVAALSTGACGSDKPVASRKTPIPVSQPATIAATTPPADAGGALACQLVNKAVDDDDLMGNGVVTAIVEAAERSTTESLRSAGLMLSDRYDIARAGDDAAARLDLTTAGINLQTACTEAGLTTATR